MKLGFVQTELADTLAVLLLKGLSEQEAWDEIERKFPNLPDEFKTRISAIARYKLKCVTSWREEQEDLGVKGKIIKEEKGGTE